MKKHVVAMVLVGGRGTRLGAITQHKAKPAVTFGGKYKLIDFVLSNLAHAQIDTVGIVTQYEPHELMHYIQRGASWDLDVNDGGVHFLTPYTTREGTKWQRGTAHAVAQHLHFLNAYNPELVLVLSGDHVYKMDYRRMLDHHRASGADITVGAFKPHDDLSRYGVLSLDEQDRVTAFEEKPDAPASDLASMGVYVFTRTALENVLKQGVGDDLDFGRDIIPKALKEHYRVCGYYFDGYFRDVGTVESLFDANLELLDHPEYLKIHDYTTHPIYTRTEDLPPHHNMSPDRVRDALVCDGTMIMGQVEHSVISSNVLIKENAFVKNSLIFTGVKIGEHSRLENVIVLEDTVILPRTELVYDRPTVIDNETLWKVGDDR